MKSFRWPLLLLVIATLVALGGYLLGVFPSEPGEGRGISVSRETAGDTVTVLVRLRHSERQTQWLYSGGGYDIDIQRRGPDLYDLDIAQLERDKEVETRRRMNTSLHLEPGRNLVGGFTYTDQPKGGQPAKQVQQAIVVELLP
ncbi:hypothetical protein CEK62_03160 [Alcanivorax sp. N3-2A]|nr:hypothetical protein CEK62_03160 [Alcanivorax sp. N3-2A]|tara:strand:- start:73617 stop:74045 length:429 start_codon:yes stop_codon:yes gene_type:complete